MTARFHRLAVALAALAIGICGEVATGGGDDAPAAPDRSAHRPAPRRPGAAPSRSPSRPEAAPPIERRRVSPAPAPPPPPPRPQLPPPPGRPGAGPRTHDLRPGEIRRPGDRGWLARRPVLNDRDSRIGRTTTPRPPGTGDSTGFRFGTYDRLRRVLDEQRDQDSSRRSSVHLRPLGHDLPSRSVDHRAPRDPRDARDARDCYRSPYYRYGLWWKHGSRATWSLWSGCRWLSRRCDHGAHSYYRYTPYCFRPYDDYLGLRSVTFYSPLYIAGAYPELPCGATRDEAWNLLTGGDTARAYDAFDCLVENAPNDGLTLVGFAVSAALLDQHDEAVDAMRDALRLEPMALLDVPGSDALDEKLAALSGRYDERARKTYGDVDALLMVAATRYLLHEDPAALYAVDIAITLGDADASARNLRALIDQRPP